MKKEHTSFHLAFLQMFPAFENDYVILDSY